MADKIVSWGGFDSKGTSGMGVTGSFSVSGSMTTNADIFLYSTSSRVSNVRFFGEYGANGQSSYHNLAVDSNNDFVWTSFRGGNYSTTPLTLSGGSNWLIPGTMKIGGITAASISSNGSYTGAYATLTLTGGGYNDATNPSINFITWDAGNQASRFQIHSRTNGGGNGKIVAVPDNGNFIIGSSTDLSAKLAVKGSGTTSSTTSLLIQNSSATENFRIYDNGNITVGLGTTTFTSIGGNGNTGPSSSIYFDNYPNAHQVHHQIITRAQGQGNSYNYLRFPTAYGGTYEFIGAGAGVTLALTNSGSTAFMNYTHTGINTNDGNIPLTISPSSRTLTFGGGSNNVNHLPPYVIILKGNQPLNSATNEPGGDVYILGGLAKSGSAADSGSVYISGGTVNAQNTLYVTGSRVGIGISTTYGLQVANTSSLLVSATGWAPTTVSTASAAVSITPNIYATAGNRSFYSLYVANPGITTSGSFGNYDQRSIYAAGKVDAPSGINAGDSRFYATSNAVSFQGYNPYNGQTGNAAGGITFTSRQVDGSDEAGIGAYYGGGSRLYIYNKYNDPDSKIIFSVGGTIRSSFFGTGNLSIGNGETDMSARLGVKGSGTTSSTTALLVQNSAGSSAFEVKDDRSATIYGPLTLGRANTGYIYANATDYIALPRQGGAAPGYLSNSTVGDGWSMISPAGEYLRVRESGLGFPNGGITYQEYSGYGYGKSIFRIYYTGSFTTTTLILKGNTPVAYAAGLNLLVAGGNSGTYENVDSKGAPGSVTVEGGSATSSSFTTHVPAGGVNIQTGLGLGTGSAADLTFSTSTTSSVASTYHTQTQRMIIKGQTGFIGIGTSSPSASLHVSGSSIFTNTVTISGSNAAVTMPSRPAFRVTGSGTMTNLTTTQNGDGTLNQNNWVIDYQQGSALTGSTGVFTAPLAGLYQISLVGRNSGYSSGISQIAVVKYSGASSAVQIMVEWASSSTMNHTGGSSITYMNVGDTLKLKVLAGEINFDGNDNWSVAYIG